MATLISDITAISADTSTLTFTLEQIQKNVDAAKEYISALQTQLPCSLQALIEYAHTISPELREFYLKNKQKFASRDKGSAGKIIEFCIFGNLPNNISAPDLLLGDIKTTHIKQLKNGKYNAKERLTLTNVGSTNNYANLQHILDNSLRENSRWKKVRQGILVVMEHTEGKWSAEEKIFNEKVTALFHYDITDNPAWMSVIESDYEKIRDCVRIQAASQKGQEYLHIHPHGTSKTATRAFGFTNKFVTRLICHYTGRALIEEKRSLMFS